MKKGILTFLFFLWLLFPSGLMAQFPSPGSVEPQSLEPIEIDNQKLATMSGDVGLDIPDAALLEIADVPDLYSCEDRLGWWVPLIVQVGLLALWFWRRADADEKEAGMILILIMIGSQMFHGSIGCYCTDSSWCERYEWMNMVVTLVAFGVYAYRDSRYLRWQKRLKSSLKKR